MSKTTPTTRHERGAILIIVMWIAFGLVSIALYFGHSMIHELRATDNRVAGAEAEQAIEGAARYISLVLSNHPGVMPDPRDYRSEAVTVGNAAFWIIGRNSTINGSLTENPQFGLTDETGKLNLNTCTWSNLYYLPRMTEELVSSVFNWRNSGNQTNSGNVGATDATYSSLNPPYAMKGTNFESTGELRMVYGMNMDILYGRDQNMNGIIDNNEKNLSVASGFDSSGVTVDNGILEYLTIYSKDINQQTNFTPRISVTNMSGMATLLTSTLSDAALIGKLTNSSTGGPGAQPPPAPTSLLQYYVSHISDGLSQADFDKLYDAITISVTTNLGMINVNTASKVVLKSLDGMTSEMADTLVNYRNSNPDNTRSIAWVASALQITSTTNLPKCHTRLTARTYQVSADIVALGLNDRGYKRVRFIFDTSTGVPQIVFRQDLTHLGWALGKDLRNQILNGKDIR